MCLQAGSFSTFGPFFLSLFLHKNTQSRKEDRQIIAVMMFVGSRTIAEHSPRSTAQIHSILLEQCSINCGIDYE